MQRFKRRTRANVANDDDELEPDREGDLEGDLEGELEIEVGRSITHFDAGLIILALAVLVAMIVIAATQ